MKTCLIYIFYLVIGFSLSACSVEPRKQVPEKLKVGQARFHKLCANCHGADGMGGSNAPKLIQDSYTSAQFPNEKLAWTILNGSKSGAMPSLKNIVNEEDIKAIIKYIRYSQEAAGLTP